MATTSSQALSPLPTDLWDGSLAKVLAEMNGAPINVHKLMAHNPGLLQAWWNFRNCSVSDGTLGARLGEPLILRLAEHSTVPQVLDIIAIHGRYVILGCMIRTWSLELDPAVNARIAAHTSPQGFALAAKRFHDKTGTVER